MYKVQHHAAAIHCTAAVTWMVGRGCTCGVNFSTLGSIFLNKGSFNVAQLSNVVLCRIKFVTQAQMSKRCLKVLLYISKYLLGSPFKVNAIIFNENLLQSINEINVFQMHLHQSYAYNNMLIPNSFLTLKNSKKCIYTSSVRNKLHDYLYLNIIQAIKYSSAHNQLKTYLHVFRNHKNYMYMLSQLILKYDK